MITQIFIIGLALFSGVKDTQCMSLLTSHFDQMRKLGKPAPGNVFYFEMSMYQKANPSRKSTADVEVNSKYYITSNQVVYISQDLLVYQDTSEVIMVLRPQRSIILARGKGESAYQQSQFQQFVEIQESILKNGTEIVCSDLKVDSLVFRRSRMRMSKDFTEASMVDEIDFLFDQNDELRSVTMYYNSESEYLYQKYNYGRLNFNYKKWKPKKLKDYVFEPDGSLLARYKNYEVTDYRKD